MRANINTTGVSLDALSKFLPALRKYFQRRVARENVEDLIQDVCVSFQARKTDQPIENAEAYLFTIARHVLSRHIRLEKLIDLDSTDFELAAIEDTAPLPDQQFQDKEFLDQVLKTIERMPPKTRQVFIMHRFESMTYREIARNFGISTSAVEKHIMSALRTLMLISERMR